MTDTEIINVDAIIKALEEYQFPKMPLIKAGKKRNVEITPVFLIKILKQQKAEIENLRKSQVKEIHIDEEFYKECQHEMKQIESKAVKKFAERVKQEINFPLAVWKVFDRLVAETAGAE